VNAPGSSPARAPEGTDTSFVRKTLKSPGRVRFDRVATPGSTFGSPARMCGRARWCSRKGSTARGHRGSRLTRRRPPRVYRRPRVAILGSGDEIVDVDRGDEIRSDGRCAQHPHPDGAGDPAAIPVNLGSRAIPAKACASTLSGRPTATSGHHRRDSVGEHDHVLSVLQEMDSSSPWNCGCALERRSDSD
jgi:hypothetical protein